MSFWKNLWRAVSDWVIGAPAPPPPPKKSSTNAAIRAARMTENGALYLELADGSAWTITNAHIRFIEEGEGLSFQFTVGPYR